MHCTVAIPPQYHAHDCLLNFKVYILSKSPHHNSKEDISVAR